MPIKPELRWYYPIDWPQISHWVRFVRAKGRCQDCGRPHGKTVHHLGDGRWWDEVRQTWRDGRGRKVPSPALAEYAPVRTTKVVLAAAHLDHDPAHCGRRHRNVRALASGATCCMTGRSTAGGSGSRCAGDGPWAICFLDPTVPGDGSNNPGPVHGLGQIWSMSSITIKDYHSMGLQLVRPVAQPGSGDRRGRGRPHAVTRQNPGRTPQRPKRPPTLSLLA